MFKRALKTFCLAVTLTVAASPVFAVGLFGSIEFSSTELSSIPKWQRVLERIEAEVSIYEACDADIVECQTAEQSSWRSFIQDHKGKPVPEVLDDVNAFLNKWVYTEDTVNWNKSDYWATPVEFLEHAGDCEDYAIIKYVTLKALGVNVDDMRIVVLRDTLRQLDHAVLAVYVEGGEVLILDSLFDGVLSHEAILQYTPYYSVNENKRWVHVMPLKGKE